MKIVHKQLIKGEPTKFYDIVDASPNNNFMVKSEKGYIVSHNCMDELNFIKGGDKDINQSSVMQLYRTIKRRIESRFQSMGKIPGVLFLISSKKSEYDFLEQYAKLVKDKPGVLVIDEPQWVVKWSPKRYSGKFFKLAVGNKYLTSKIVPEDHSNEEDLEKLKNKGYRILDVPVEHREAFELDINSALMDIAGIAVASTSKYIYPDKWKACISPKLENPFIQEVISIGFDDDSSIEDYLDLTKIKDIDKKYPCALHLDMSLTGDTTGLAMSTLAGARQIKRLVKGKIVNEKDMRYRSIIELGIKAKSGTQIPYHKIRKFIFYLRDTLGFDLRYISADSFQSADMLQQLRLNGFETRIISMDRTPEPYETFKNALNEGRYVTYQNDYVEDEVLNLEEDKLTGKIDHTNESSKDVTDAIVGSVYHLSLMKSRDFESGSTSDLLDEIFASTSYTGSDSWVLDDLQRNIDKRKKVQQDKNDEIREDEYDDEFDDPFNENDNDEDDEDITGLYGALASEDFISNRDDEVLYW